MLLTLPIQMDVDAWWWLMDAGCSWMLIEVDHGVQLSWCQATCWCLLIILNLPSYMNLYVTGWCLSIFMNYMCFMFIFLSGWILFINMVMDTKLWAAIWIWGIVVEKCIFCHIFWVDGCFHFNFLGCYMNLCVQRVCSVCGSRMCCTNWFATADPSSLCAAFRSFVSQWLV
jgi:hypothetical protein